MASATYPVAVLLRGRLRLTGLMSLVHRSRPVWGIADDVTKYSTVCLHQRKFQGPRTLNPHVRLSSGFLSSGHLICDIQLKNTDCLYSSANLRCPQILHVASYRTKPGTREEPGAAQSELSLKRETQSAAGKGDSLSGSGETGAASAANAPEKQLTLFQRFKKAYKEHGKILVAVHVATSIVWFGSFYTAARCGIDIVPLLEKWNFSETFIKPFRAGGLGDIALAYLMYKLATPARYTVTLTGTNFAIRYLRRTGKMAPKSQEDSLRQLYKEGRLKLKDSKLRSERLQRLKAARKKKAEAKKSKKA